MTPQREMAPCVELPFTWLDVFSDHPLAGNPVVVVHGAEHLTAEQMQAIARETDHSETCFVMRPASAGQAAVIRLFSPTQEMPFAGHPLLGAAAALIGAQTNESDSTLSLELNSTTFDLRVSKTGHNTFESWLTTRVPPVSTGQSVKQAALALGLPEEKVLNSPGPACVDPGLPYTVILVNSVSALNQAWLSLASAERHLGAGVNGAVAVAASSGDGVYQMRVFGPALGIPEDPVTGSAAIAVAAVLRASGSVGPSGRVAFTQGHNLNRPGRLEIRFDENNTSESCALGGAVSLLGRGVFYVPQGAGENVENWR